MSENFSNFSNEYELRILAGRISDTIMNKSLSRAEKLQSLADTFIEIKELMGWTEEELQAEIRAMKSVTQEEIINCIINHE